VHGSLIGWKDLLEESRETYRWLRQAAPGQPLQVVFFTWPSDRPLSALVALDFTLLGQQSSYNSLYLGQVLAHMPPEARVSLLGHSHGARIVSSTLHLISGGELHGMTLIPPERGYPRIRVVLAAAAMDHHWMLPGERYGRALERTEGLLNLRNSQDMALWLYPFRRPFGVESLGRVGLRGQDRISYAPYLPKVRELDIGPVIGGRHAWPHYYGSQQVAQTVAPFVYYTNDQTQSARQPAPRSSAGTTTGPAGSPGRPTGATRHSVSRIRSESESQPAESSESFTVPSAVRIPTTIPRRKP